MSLGASRIVLHTAQRRRPLPLFIAPYSCSLHNVESLRICILHKNPLCYHHKSFSKRLIGIWWEDRVKMTSKLNFFSFFLAQDFLARIPLDGRTFYATWDLENGSRHGIFLFPSTSAFSFQIVTASAVDHQYPISITDHLQKLWVGKIWVTEGESPEWICGFMGPTTSHHVLLTSAASSYTLEDDVSSHH